MVELAWMHLTELNYKTMDSLLNEMKLNFKRGQKISYRKVNGEIGHGTYVMASSAEGYIVLDRGNGQPVVVPMTAIDTIISFKNPKK